jgi:hypothetical protein
MTIMSQIKSLFAKCQPRLVWLVAIWALTAPGLSTVWPTRPRSSSDADEIAEIVAVTPDSRTMVAFMFFRCQAAGCFPGFYDDGESRIQ